MAYKFAAASSQYFEAGSSPISTYPLTIAGWVYPLDATNQYVIGAVCTGGGNARQVLIVDGTTDKVSMVTVSNSNSSANAQSAGSYAANAWCHAAGVVSSNLSRIAYINGGSSGTNTTDLATTGMDRVLIGARRNATSVGVYLDGYIADLGIWNIALDPADIAALGKGVSPIYVRPQSLKVYHPLIRGNVAPIGPAFTATNGPTVVEHPRIYL